MHANKHANKPHAVSRLHADAAEGLLHPGEEAACRRQAPAEGEQTTLGCHSTASGSLSAPLERHMAHTSFAQLRLAVAQGIPGEIILHDAIPDHVHIALRAGTGLQLRL